MRQKKCETKMEEVKYEIQKENLNVCHRPGHFGTDGETCNCERTGTSLSWQKKSPRKFNVVKPRDITPQ